MVVDSTRFGQSSSGCKPWSWYCNPNTDINPIPYGAPGWVNDLISGSAFTLTNIFGKYQQPRNIGFNIDAYMPIILMGGAAVLLVTLMKR
ncbi:hypothetical protein L0244_22120 [bacterium]|nr:hypothetical protein [bacterium]